MAGTSVDFGLNPDLAVEQQLAEQRQHVADMLSQRGATPLQIHSGTGSPLQAMGQMFAAYRGKQLRTENEAKLRSNAADYNTRLAEGVQDYMRQRNGTGVAPDPQEMQQSQDYGTPAPAPMKGDAKTAAIMALTSRNPVVAKLGQMDYAHELSEDAPKVVSQGSILVGRDNKTVATNPLDTKKAIPANWQEALPAGAVREPNDPAGVFRMKGTDGQLDVYHVEFEAGKPIGYKKLDSSQTIKNTTVNPPAVTVTTVQDPKDPTKTLQVDARTYHGGSIGSPGVVGYGQKPAAEGVARAEGYGTFQNVNANLDKLEKQVELVLGSKLSGVTGVKGMIPNIPGSAAADSAARLEALRSQVGFETLQALRNAAHNGASGLGQVTEKEHTYLQQQMGNLQKAQSEQEIRRVLTGIKTWIGGARQRYQSNYDARFAAGGGSSDPVAAALDKYK